MADDDRGGAAARTAAAEGAPGSGDLRAAVARVQRELAAYPPALPDRTVAEDELAALAHGAACPDPEPLRHSLLLIAAALGSVSALAAPLADLRQAVEHLTPPL